MRPQSNPTWSEFENFGCGCFLTTMVLVVCLITIFSA